MDDEMSPAGKPSELNPINSLFKENVIDLLNRDDEEPSPIPESD
jgi:hypothetical protein